MPAPTMQIFTEDLVVELSRDLASSLAEDESSDLLAWQ
jgi:hypothetical protein